MSAWFSIGIAVIKLLTKLMEWSDRERYMNEGAKRLAAQQLEEANRAFARAAGISAQVDGLTDREVNDRLEEMGWIT